MEADLDEAWKFHRQKPHKSCSGIQLALSSLFDLAEDPMFVKT